MMEEVSWPFSLYMQCIIIATVIEAMNVVPSMFRSDATALTCLISSHSHKNPINFTDDET